MIKEGMIKITEEKIFDDYMRIKCYAAGFIAGKKYNKAMEAIELAGHIMTGVQFLDKDDELEQMIKKIEIDSENSNTIEPNSKKICLYDYQGIEGRGLTWIYAEALVNLGFVVDFITYKRSNGSYCNLKKMIEENGGSCYEVNGKSLYENAKEIKRLLKLINPSKLFVHTIPCDISLLVAIKDVKLCKIFINLEDHGFQIGLSFMDRIIEFRNYGYSFTLNGRKIADDKLYMLPYYPVESPKRLELPDFVDKKKKMIFSGGALYKIEGNNKFFEIVAYILDNHDDSYFVYAGYGSNQKLIDLRKKYSDRVFLIPERADLSYFMEEAFLYLSTYPVPGALMCQYAALKGKIPLTLQDENAQIFSVRGILQDTDVEGIIFNNADALEKEVDRLFDDETYRDRKGEEVKKLVISKQDFQRELSYIIEGRQTSYIKKIMDINRGEIREKYWKSMNDTKYVKYYFNRNRMSLWIFFKFPTYCFNSVIRRIIR